MNATPTRIARGSTETTAIYSIEGDLYYERTFAASPGRLWQAFTDPAQIPMWWGPHSTTTEVMEMDVRVGGAWRFISHASDREDVVFYGEYLELDPPNTIRWTFLFDVEGVGPQGGPETVRFEPVEGGTKVTSIGHMGSPEVIQMALATGMTKGAIETWDRLEALLAGG